MNGYFVNRDNMIYLKIFLASADATLVSIT